MSYTYAILAVTSGTFKEIESKLKAAGYEHAFHDDGTGAVVIDMHGIALRRSTPPARPRDGRRTSWTVERRASHSLRMQQHAATLRARRGGGLGYFREAFMEALKLPDGGTPDKMDAAIVDTLFERMKERDALQQRVEQLQARSDRSCDDCRCWIGTRDLPRWAGGFCSHLNISVPNCFDCGDWVALQSPAAQEGE